MGQESVTGSYRTPKSVLPLFVIRGGAAVVLVGGAFYWLIDFISMNWYTGDWVIFYCVLLASLGEAIWKTRLFLEKRNSALQISVEGIRNLDPNRINVISWEEIVEFRPRPLSRRL